MIAFLSSFSLLVIYGTVYHNLEKVIVLYKENFFGKMEQFVDKVINRFKQHKSTEHFMTQM